MNPVGVFRHTAADAMALIRSMQARAMDNGKPACLIFLTGMVPYRSSFQRQLCGT
jgi:hypothetical protein